MTRTKLTKEQARRVRELMLDEGNTRAEAVAWVLAFEPDGLPRRAIPTQGELSANLERDLRPLALSESSALGLIDEVSNQNCLKGGGR